MSTVLATAVEGDLLWAWWATIGAGVAVTAVVVVLLQTLLRTVHEIDRALQRAWNMGTQVARNTATSWVLVDTARMVQRAGERAAGERAAGEERQRGGA